ncbi:MAG TPA: amidase [Caulobacteraceae bacterium]|jgi:Asp-tRNA(Asn)/Glu-tRNA(Gln) amidotransferase A subunit family amidase|nr:amidase [Caulobacteraceae bacterium]
MQAVQADHGLRARLQRLRLPPYALDDARRIDAQRAAGAPLGPLAGIPVAVKDSVDVAGMPTTCCWDRLAPARGGYGLIPERDAPVVARPRQAGAIIVGKTNTPAFCASYRTATSWAGTTCKAIDRRLMPAGSSACSATAVAARFAVTGVAEETGGSIQNPAGAQSLVAVRPTFGLTPNTGVAPMAASTLDMLGPHAKSVRDAAWMLDVMAGYTAEDPKTLAGLDQIPQGGYGRDLRQTARAASGWGSSAPGWRAEPLSPGIASQYDPGAWPDRPAGGDVGRRPLQGHAIRQLRQPGITAGPCDRARVDGPRPRSLSAPQPELRGLVVRGTGAAGRRRPLRRRPTAALPACLSQGTADAGAAKRRYLATFGEVLVAHQLDGLVFPQMMTEVPPRDGAALYRATATQAINIAGLPGVVVPGGRLHSGSPFALIFIGRPWSEAALLSMAYAYERGWPGRIAPRLRA